MSPLSSEWSSPFTGDPPESLESQVAQIGALVRALPTPRPPAESYPIPDRPRIVSVFGGRGTGKSTLLHFAAHRLAQHRDHLVLPVIDPEAFAPGDTLIGWALAELERIFTDADLAEDVEPDGRALGQLFEDLRRAEAARGSAYLEGLEQRGLSFEDFARDAVKLPMHGVRAASRVELLLDGLAAARQTPDLRIVIPVDDADLFPELLPSIVSDAQLLSSSPRVVLLFAADRETLAQALQLAFLAQHRDAASTALEHHLLDASAVRAIVARRLVKHFPRSLRIDLSSLTLAQRLSFRPITAADQPSLVEVLPRFGIPYDPDRTLADLFVVRDTAGRVLGPSQNALGLSDNARDIRQLHEAIASIDPAQKEAASRAMWTILQHGLDGLRPELPGLVHDAVVIEDVNGSRKIRFDFSNIAMGKSTASGATIFARPQAATPTEEDPLLVRLVSLRRLHAHYAEAAVDGGAAEGPDSSGDPDAARHRQRLPTQFAYLALLAWEVTQRVDGEHSLIDLDGHIRRVAVPSGLNSSNLSVGPQDAIDWAYWLYPDWEQGSDVFACSWGWDRLITAVAGPGNAPSTYELLELSLLVHLALVLSVQRHRAVPTWVAHLEHEEVVSYLAGGRWEERRAALQGELEEMLTLTFSEARARETPRDADFLHWVSTFMPLMASPLLTTARMSRWILDLWRKLVPSTARSGAIELVARYARDHMGGDLADGDIALLAALDAEDPAVAAHVQSLREVRAGLQRQQTLRQQGILAELKAARRDPNAIEALLRLGATTDVLQNLLFAGVPPNALPGIAEAFPATSAARDVKDEPAGGQRLL